MNGLPMNRLVSSLLPEKVVGALCQEEIGSILVPQAFAIFLRVELPSSAGFSGLV